VLVACGLGVGLFLPGVGQRNPLIIIIGILIYGAVALYCENKHVKSFFHN
jgi:tRNA G46 methylase TrmB